MANDMCFIVSSFNYLRAHLQRATAIGYLLPLADLMLSALARSRTFGADPPAPFDREAPRRVASLLFFRALVHLNRRDPFLSLSLSPIRVLSVLLPTAACISHTAAHYNYRERGSESPWNLSAAKA